MIRLLDLSLPSPAENLALDEILLDHVANGAARDTLRFWESPVPFVVLGTGQVAAAEIHLDHCAQDGIPVLRRCTAGGCVLQGPGCLNYSLALTYAHFPETATLHGSYAHILGRICTALAPLGIDARHEGACDLAVAGKKFSGNAQRRKRDALLHHGTLLYRVDIAAMARYLREPGERPAYRAARSHEDFVQPVPLSPEALKQAVGSAFHAEQLAEALDESQGNAIATLAREKYERRAWTFRR